MEELEEGWLPLLPDETRGKGFYNRLLSRLEKLENTIERANGDTRDTEEEIIVVGSGESLNWQYYQFKSRIVEAKEHIRTVMLGFRDRYFKEAPAIPWRLKRGSIYGSKGDRDLASKARRENIRDRLFQEEALREISETYQYAMAQFDSLKTEFIDNYLNVALLCLVGQGVLSKKTEKIELQFQSCITGLGDWEIRFLIEKYEALFEELDFSYKVDKKNKTISVEGYGLKNLLLGETGIHLFYLAHQNPLPIKLFLKSEGDTFLEEDSFRVIRIYDGTYTLTDLRTGFTNAVNITVGEFKLLVYAGIAQQTRQDLMPF